MDYSYSNVPFFEGEWSHSISQAFFIFFLLASSIGLLVYRDNPERVKPVNNVEHFAVGAELDFGPSASFGSDSESLPSAPVGIGIM